MLIKDWFNFLATYFLGGAHAKEAAINGLSSCSCFKMTTDGLVPADEENLQILAMHSEDGDISKYLKMANKRSITMKDTLFKLYTIDNQSGIRIYPDNTTSLPETYNPLKPTIVTAHGFMSSGETEWMKQLRKAQLEALDCNFISVDWQECADNCCYFGARNCAIAVGKYLGQLLRLLIQHGAKPEEMHLMGHSLGAHLVSTTTIINIGRITGFDPPHFGFYDQLSDERLDPSDAKFVDVIHTSSILGWKKLLGDIDFFPNSAIKQPGCNLSEFCSHSASYYYYIQSLYNTHKYAASRCYDIQSALIGSCHGVTAYMGVDSYKGQPGAYHIKVSEPPTGEPT